MFFYKVYLMTLIYGNPYIPLKEDTTSSSPPPSPYKVRILVNPKDESESVTLYSNSYDEFLVRKFVTINGRNSRTSRINPRGRFNERLASGWRELDLID